LGREFAGCTSYMHGDKRVLCAWDLRALQEASMMQVESYCGGVPYSGEWP